MEYYSDVKNSEKSPWVNLEILTLSEVSQTKTCTIWHHLYVDSKTRHKQTYLQNRNRVTDMKNKHGYLREMGWKRNKL